MMTTIKGSKSRPDPQSPDVRDAVAEIIADVRARGDAAVLDAARRFDGAERAALRVSEAEAEAALAALDGGLRSAMERALRNIRAFAAAQRASLRELPSFSPEAGVTLGHRHIPVDSVCCYVPGGSYPLFSTALMLVVPAKTAGVPRVAACAPVMKGSNAIHPATLAALRLAGADEIYAVGGAQAVAAFAYGTAQIAPVSFIAGPGNRYVAEAKRQCYGQVGIDCIAGPSEVLIIADESARARTVACDLLAQCEHDGYARAALVTTSAALASAVLSALKTELAALPTAEIAARSWDDFGEIFLAESLDEAVDFANERASEHLELQTRENERLAKKLRNYGALFIGENAAEVFGDYAAGTNHILPTMRAARWTGGLWVGSFLKTVCFQSLSAEGAAALAPATAALAAAEGLAAHRNAALCRQGAGSYET